MIFLLRTWHDVADLSRSLGPVAGIRTSALLRARIIGLPGGSSARHRDLTLADVAWQFRHRNWPPRASAYPPGVKTRTAADDLEPYVLGSFDNVGLAYDLGQLTDTDYQTLARAAA